MKYPTLYGVLLLLILISVTYVSASHDNQESIFSELKIVKQIEQQIEEYEKTKGDFLLLFSSYKNHIPDFVLEMIKIIIQMIVSLLFLSLFRKTVILEGNLLINQTKDVLYRGFVIYLMGIALILIFTLSLVGFPFALFLLLISWIFSGLGEAALSVIVGEWMVEKMQSEGDIYIKFWLGLSMLQLLKNIPLLGAIGRIFMIPFLSLGMFAQVLLNEFLHISPIFIHEEYENERSSYGQERLYEIITKDLTKKGEKK